MGSMTFIKADNTQRVTFDSSPEYSLSKLFGWPADSIRLEMTESDPRRYKYSVTATSTEGGREFFVGTLFQKTREEIRRELSQR